jgi:hypothetical protein
MTQMVAPQDTKTKMVQPPNPDKTKLETEKKKEQVVEAVRWIKAIRPLRLEDGTVISEGEVAQVPVKWAKEFCLKKFNGPYPFSGERTAKNADAQPLSIVRAVLVTEKEALQIREQMLVAHKSHLDEDLPETVEVEVPEAL